jgi:tuftelin-interacting protein 11
MFAKLWEPLEHPKRWMEVVTKLKEILLDNGSALLPYVVLLVDLVVSPNLAKLRRSWTIYYPGQDEWVLFLKSLPQLLPVQSFLEDVVKLELSKSAEWFDAAWEAEPGWVWLRPWISIIGQEFLEPLV